MDFEKYLKIVKERHPGLKFKNKHDIWTWRLLGFFFPYLLKNKTVVFKTIYLPVPYEEFESSSSALGTLIHESVHLDQKVYGQWFYANKDSKPIWFGYLRFYFKYLFWKFFIKFATGRVDLEAEAFVVEYLHRKDSDWSRIVWFLEGPIYFWAGNPEYIQKQITKYKGMYEEIVGEDYDYLRD